MDEFERRLGAAWTAPDAWEFLTELTGLGSRMAGSAGERAAAALVAEQFEAAGLQQVGRESFELSVWERGTAALSAGDRSFDALALPYSPGGDVAGELVDVGHGTPAEIDEATVTDRIVVASTTTPPGGRFIHRMEKYGTAVENGAAGFVFANHVPGQLAPTGSLTFGEEAAIPAVGVSKETGQRLRTLADGTQTADETDGRATLTVQATTEPGTSHNVVGRTGPTTDRELLVVAHYDAHDIAEGALDNGCGVATLVTVAQLLAETDLARGVRFAAVGAEEVGLLGSKALVEQTTLDEITAVVNLDGAGRFRNLQALSHDSAATAAVARAVADRTHHPIELQEQPHPFSDQWPFVMRGVPALQLHSTPDEPTAGVGGLAADRGRGWGHTTADTRDKIDVRNVREHAMLTALLVRELADRQPPRLDGDRLRAAFREAEFEPGMRAAGLWPDDWD